MPYAAAAVSHILCGLPGLTCAAGTVHSEQGEKREHVKKKQEMMSDIEFMMGNMALYHQQPHFGSSQNRSSSVQ